MRALNLVLAIAFIIQFTGCNAQGEKTKAKPVASDKVEVYYFHFTARCYTCRNVEAKTQEFLAELYPEQVKSGNIFFAGINLDDPANKALADRLNVHGQSILVVNGDKNINIINEGFMFAARQPEKYKETIKNAVETVKK